MTTAAVFREAHKAKIEQTPEVQVASEQTQAIKTLVRNRLQEPQDRAVALKIFTTIQLAKQEIGQLEKRIANIQDQAIGTTTTKVEKVKLKRNETVAQASERLADKDYATLLEQRKQVGQLHEEISQKKTELNAALNKFDRMLPGEEDMIERMNQLATEICKKQEKGSVKQAKTQETETWIDIDGKKVKMLDLDCSDDWVVVDAPELQALKGEFSEIRECLHEYLEIRRDFKEAARQKEIVAPAVKVAKITVRSARSVSPTSPRAAESGGTASITPESDDSLEAPAATRRFTEG